MTRRGVLGGVEPDPNKGKPFRHTREKALLMMRGMSGDRCAVALRLLIDKHPESTLDALITASAEFEQEGQTT